MALAKANRIDGTERIAVEVVHHLQDRGAAESLQWLPLGGLAADLRVPTDTPPHIRREPAQNPPCCCRPDVPAWARPRRQVLPSARLLPHLCLFRDDFKRADDGE